MVKAEKNSSGKYELTAEGELEMAAAVDSGGSDSDSGGGGGC